MKRMFIGLVGLFYATTAWGNGTLTHKTPEGIVYDESLYKMDRIKPECIKYVDNYFDQTLSFREVSDGKTIIIKPFDDSKMMFLMKVTPQGFAGSTIQGDKSYSCTGIKQDNFIMLQCLVPEGLCGVSYNKQFTK